jgi:hypothetical protein
MPMKRVWGNGLSGLMLLVGVAAASGGTPACVHDDSTIFVSNVLAPQFVTAGMACTFTADPTQPTLPQGIRDVALAPEYTAEFLVGNQIVPAGNPNQPQTETSFVTIKGAVVRIVDSAGDQLNTYTANAATTIPPSSGTTPGYASLGVTIIDSGTAVSLAKTIASMNPNEALQVVSYVRFFGNTLGGDSVESNEFGFPVNICLGCLITFPSAEDFVPETPTVGIPQPNCLNSAAASNGASASEPCALGQDLPVDCSTCLRNPVCNPQPTAGTTPIVDAGGGG